MCQELCVSQLSNHVLEAREIVCNGRQLGRLRGQRIEHVARALGKNARSMQTSGVIGGANARECYREGRRLIAEQ